MPKIAPEKIKLYGTIKARTESAILLEVNIHPDAADGISTEPFRAIWFPLSQVHQVFTGSVLNGGLKRDYLVVSTWIAEQKGIPAHYY